MCSRVPVENINNMKATISVEQFAADIRKLYYGYADEERTILHSEDGSVSVKHSALRLLTFVQYA